jgi:hypothetical protein
MRAMRAISAVKAIIQANRYITTIKDLVNSVTNLKKS